jgi:hypothetical protein
MVYVAITGYSSVKEFFAPDYAAGVDIARGSDIRTQYTGNHYIYR